MKIVEAKPFQYPFTCACGSKLVAEAGDVRYAEFGVASTGNFQWNYYVNCPVCARDRRLKFDEVPPNVKMLAQKMGDKP